MDTMKFAWLCSYFLSFFISLLLLSIFWNHKISRLAGFYAIVPGIHMIILNSLPFWNGVKPMMIIYAAIEMAMIVPVVYFFRYYYKMRFVVAWILLIVEIFRWTWLVISSVLKPDSVFSFFEAYLFYFYFSFPFVVLLFCVFSGKVNVLQQKNNQTITN